jgi:Uncharacterized protein conserved in bacteria (DUF2325)
MKSAVEAWADARARLHCHGTPPLVEIARFNALADENGVLTRELARVQERMTRVMAQKAAELERVNSELVQARAAAIAKDTRIAFLTQDLQALQASVTYLEDKPAVQAQPITLHLNHKVVLYVGGRFTHHDGGVEDNVSVLEANLAAADLVICQTGCISHNAYWRVKDFCKRTGKRCVFVENPSASSLERGLGQADALSPDNADR